MVEGAFNVCTFSFGLMTKLSTVPPTIKSLPAAAKEWNMPEENISTFRRTGVASLPSHTIQPSTGRGSGVAGLEPSAPEVLMCVPKPTHTPSE